MELNPTKLAIRQSHDGDSLELPPPSSTIHLSQERSGFDGGTFRNCLDLLDRPDQLEPHASIFPEIVPRIKAAPVGPRNGSLAECTIRQRDRWCRRSPVAPPAGLP